MPPLEENEEIRRIPLLPLKTDEGIGETYRLAEGIYRVYPRKIDRLKAIHAIQRALAKIDAERLHAAVVRYAKMPGLERENGQFIPSPVRWFNEDRWKDYLTKPASSVVDVPRPSKAVDDVRVMFEHNSNPSAGERTLILTFIARLTPDDFNFLTDQERALIASLQNGEDNKPHDQEAHETSPTR